MVELMKELGLKRRDSELSGYSALFDGKNLVFVESEWKVATIAKLAWKYGLGIYKLNQHIKEMLGLFDRYVQRWILVYNI